MTAKPPIPTTIALPTSSVTAIGTVTRPELQTTARIAAVSATAKATESRPATVCTKEIASDYATAAVSSQEIVSEIGIGTVSGSAPRTATRTEPGLGTDLATRSHTTGRAAVDELRRFRRRDDTEHIDQDIAEVCIGAVPEQEPTASDVQEMPYEEMPAWRVASRPHCSATAVRRAGGQVVWRLRIEFDLEHMQEFQ